MKLIEALEGLEMKEGDDFPQGDKTLRKEDHQAFLRQFIFEIKGGKHQILEVVAKEKTIFPPACKFAYSVSERATVRDYASPAEQPGRRSRPLCSRTEGLTVRFGGLTALNKVNFEVQRGEIRAIIGPNGAGKSTFFNCLTGVLRPTSGRILLNGDDITGLPPNLISQKGIARSYQITNILPNATTLENVRIAAQSRRHGWNMLAHHRAFRDIIDKAEAVLDVGRPCRQGRRTGRQSVARRAAQSRDRHRARHRAAAAVPRRADRRHERGRDPRHHAAGARASPRISPS